MTDGPWTKYGNQSQAAAPAAPRGPWDKFSGPRDESYLDTMLSVPRGIASAIPAVGEGTYRIGEALAGLAGSEGEGSVREWFHNAAENSRRTKETWAGQPQTWSGQMISGASQSVGLMAPGIVASVLAPEVAAPALFGATVAPGAIVQGGQSTGKALDAGKSPARALAYGASDAAAEVVFEKLPVGRLLKDIGAGTGLGKMFLNQLATEIPTEIATTLYQNLNEYSTLHPEKSFGEFLSEQPAAIRDTVAQTILQSGMMTGGTTVARKIANRNQAQPTPVAGPDAAQTTALTGEAIPTGGASVVAPDAAAALGVTTPANAVAAVRARRAAAGITEPEADQSVVPADQSPAAALTNVLAQRQVNPEDKQRAGDQRVAGSPPPAPAPNVTPDQRTEMNKGLVNELNQAQPGSITVRPPEAPPEVAAQANDLASVLDQNQVTPPGNEAAPVPVQGEAAPVQDEAPVIEEAKAPEADTSAVGVEEAAQDQAPEETDPLAAQIAALNDKKRTDVKAVLVPKGYEGERPHGHGIVMRVIPGAGTLYFHTGRGVTTKFVNDAMKEGTLFSELGITPPVQEQAPVTEESVAQQPEAPVGETNPDEKPVVASEQQAEEPAPKAATEELPKPKKPRVKAAQPTPQGNDAVIEEKDGKRIIRLATDESTKERTDEWHAKAAENAEKTARRNAKDTRYEGAQGTYESLEAGLKKGEVTPEQEAETRMKAFDTDTSARVVEASQAQARVAHDVMQETVEKGQPDFLVPALEAEDDILGGMTTNEKLQHARMVEQARKENLRRKKALVERLTKTMAMLNERLAAARKADVEKNGPLPTKAQPKYTIQKRVGDANPNAVVWMAQVKTILNLLNKEGINSIAEQVNTFLADEQAMLEGDGAPMRKSRRIFGEDARGKSTGGESDVADSAVDDTAQTGEESMMDSEEAGAVSSEVDDMTPVEAADEQPVAEDELAKKYQNVEGAEPEGEFTAPVEFDAEGKPIAKQPAKAVTVGIKKKRVLKPVTPVARSTEAVGVRKTLGLKSAENSDGYNSELDDEEPLPEQPTLDELLADTDLRQSARDSIVTLRDELGGREYYDRDQVQPAERLDMRDKVNAQSGVPIERSVARSGHTFGELMDEIEQDSGVSAQIGELLGVDPGVTTEVTVALGNLLRKAVGHVQVIYVDDAVFDMFKPRAGAYYLDGYDVIVMRQSLRDNPFTLAGIGIHEATHAAMASAINANPDLKAQIDRLRNVVKAHVASAQDWNGSMNWAEDAHEFMSDVFGDPEFTQYLATVPLSRLDLMKLRIPATQNSLIKTVFDGFKKLMSDTLGLEQILYNMGLRGSRRTAFEAAMDLSAVILERAPAARAVKGMGQATGNIYASPRPELKGRWVKGTWVDADPVAKKLYDRGLDAQTAQDVSEALNATFGSTITDDDIDAVVATFAKPIIAPVTSGGKNKPPMSKDLSNALNDAPRGMDSKSSKWRRAMLGGMSLDFIDREYRAYFPGAKGNALSRYVNALLEHDAVRASVEEVHYRDYASIEELKRTNPAEAAKVEEFVAAIRPFDVNVGNGAKNDHLGKNARRGLQAKKALPRLNQMFNDMEPATQDLVLRMAKNYRESFNDYVRGVTYRILEDMDVKLSNSDMTRIIDHVVEGKLDAQDKADINNDILYNALRKAENIRTRKGMYFPSMRFGNWVVQTRIAIAKPTLPTVTTKSGRKNVPVTTEVDGNTVRFIYDQSIRGARPAVTKAIDRWLENHDLTLLDHGTRYRDRADGKIVSSGEMEMGRDYDTVVEIKLQNEGVHMFETEKEAEAFYQEAKKDEANGDLEWVKGVMEAHEVETSGTLTPSAITAVVRAVDQSKGLSDGKKKQLAGLLQTAVSMQLPGNRYEKRLMGRRNVLGAHEDVGRAAAQYGRQVGNAIAAVQSNHEAASSLAELKEIASKTNDKANKIRSQVVNELVRRENLSSGPLTNNQWENDLMTVNSIDKLASPMSWALNATQVAMNVFPMLGGQFGFAKTAKAIGKAYAAIGAGQAVKTGVANTKDAITSWGKTEIDPVDPVASIRKNLGVKYKDLIDALVARKDIAEGVGIENAEQFSANRGAWGRALAKVERITRQMPNTIEAINRSATAVASYDLAIENGMSHQDAIQYATDMVRRTQFRYDQVNRARWMNQNRALKFFFTFKQYPLNAYQLLAESAEKAFRYSSKEERLVGFRQLGGLVLTQAMVAGALSIPGMEAIKMLSMLAALLGIGDGWDDFQERARKLAEEMTGKTGADVITKGAVSAALGIDLSNRLSWSDMMTGFAPKGNSAGDLFRFFGETVAGAPGGMIVDWVTGINDMGTGAMKGDPEAFMKGLSKLVPMKVASDTIKAAEGLRSGKMNVFDAGKQVIGIRSLRQANIGDDIGARIRKNAGKKDKEKELIGDFLDAVTPADAARAISAIRRYNATVPDGAKQISVDGLRRLRRQNMAVYNN